MLRTVERPWVSDQTEVFSLTFEQEVIVAVMVILMHFIVTIIFTQVIVVI